MKNPFKKGDRVALLAYVGVVLRANEDGDEVRVRWHPTFVTTERAHILSFADPQPLCRLMAREDFAAEAMAREGAA